MIRINLLPVKKSKKREAAQQQFIFAGIGLLALLLVCYYSYQDLNSQISERTSKNASLQAEVDSLKQATAAVQELEKKKALLEQKLGIIETLYSNKTGPVHMLDDIASTIPEKVWLSSVDETQKKVKLLGVALSNEVIADFISKLEESPYFSEVTLLSTEQKEKEGLKLKDFSLTASVTSEDKKASTATQEGTTSVATPGATGATGTTGDGKVVEGQQTEKK